MNIYSFEGVKNILVVGDCHGDIKTFINGIKNGISVKSEDAEQPHPMELERMARKNAMTEAMRNTMRGPGEGRRGLRFEDFRNRITIDNGPRPEAQSLDEVYRDIREKLKSGYGSFAPYSNSVFIVTGDCGIGFNKEKYYIDLFERFNKILSYNNTFIVFVRGNHDDPYYFDGEKINLSNIKAVPDYSVINANGKTILCVGGAISIDRTWRAKQEERINRFSESNLKRLYWKNEAPTFNKELLNEITSSTKIDMVVSHSAPSFVTPETHIGVDEWSESDKTLLSDIEEERKVFDKIFETLRDNGMKPKYWAYGHFGISFIEKRSDTIFRCLNNGFNPINIDTDLFMFFNDEENKKKKGKKKKVINKLASNDPVGGFNVPNPAYNPFDNHGIAANAVAAEPENDGIEEEEINDNPWDDAMEEAAPVVEQGEPIGVEALNGVAAGQANGLDDTTVEIGQANINDTVHAIYERLNQRVDGQNIAAFVNYAPVYNGNIFPYTFNDGTTTAGTNN